MKILFDQGTPLPLRLHLPNHTIHTAFEQGWAKLANGDLLDTAEGQGYELFITTDKNLKYQQNMASRVIAIIVLMSTSWPRIQSRTDEIRDAVDAIDSGAYMEIEI